MSKAEDVWQAIKRNPGISVAGLAAATNMTDKQARAVAYQLWEQHSITKWTVSHKGHAEARYKALAGATRYRWGQNPRSRENLVLGPGFQAQNRKRGNPPPVPMSATELERCWPVRKSIIDESRDSDSLAAAGGNVRPEFTEAA